MAKYARQSSRSNLCWPNSLAAGRCESGCVSSSSITWLCSLTGTETKDYQKEMELRALGNLKDFWYKAQERISLSRWELGCNFPVVCEYYLCLFCDRCVYVHTCLYDSMRFTPGYKPAWKWETKLRRACDPTLTFQICLMITIWSARNSLFPLPRVVHASYSVKDR